MLSDFFDTYATEYKRFKMGSWCYEDGCVYRGLELLHKATGEDRWLNHIIRLVEAQIVEGPALLNHDPSEYNIDNIQSGRTLLYLHKVTGEDRYMDATAPLLRQLATHPRTLSGVYWHKLRYPWQIWLDGLYMGPPFQIGHALVTGNDEAIEDSLTQIATALKMAFDPETGLYAHAFDEARMQRWAHPETGKSTAFWARALGWLAMALVDVAELVGPERFEPLRQTTIDLFEKVRSLRQPNGLWLQVIDRPDLAGNYQEGSASAMFVYAFLVADRLGIAPAPEENLLELLVQQHVRQKPDGTSEMFDICSVAGLGPFRGRYRDGTAEYYLTEERVADDPKGVAPLMMSVAEDIMAKKAQ